ncbi:hypothetical protein HZC35_04890 [Candidatus Saganbacteria bacterium]|nr:hypothetical protein [Candidatus Saganbacteria bacterium]
MVDIDPINEGQKIARGYLSKLGWAREWRRTVEQEIRPAWTREEEEEKFRKADQMEEDAEANLSTEFDKWRKSNMPEAKAVLRTILNELGNRTDLGFFGKRIIDRIKEILRPF